MNNKEFKEFIIFVGCILVVFLVIIGVYCRNTYIDKIKGYESQIEQLKSENQQLSEKVEDYNENVYNMFNKQPYELRVNHDDTHITYKQDKFGLFDSYTKSIIY